MSSQSSFFELIWSESGVIQMMLKMLLSLSTFTFHVFLSFVLFPLFLLELVESHSNGAGADAARGPELLLANSTYPTPLKAILKLQLLFA